MPHLECIAVGLLASAPFVAAFVYFEWGDRKVRRWLVQHTKT